MLGILQLKQLKNESFEKNVSNIYLHNWLTYLKVIIILFTSNFKDKNVLSDTISG